MSVSEYIYYSRRFADNLHETVIKSYELMFCLVLGRLRYCSHFLNWIGLHNSIHFTSANSSLIFFSKNSDVINSTKIKCLHKINFIAKIILKKFRLPQTNKKVLKSVQHYIFFLYCHSLQQYELYDTIEIGILYSTISAN